MEKIQQQQGENYEIRKNKVEPGYTEDVYTYIYNICM